jgi:hypothetical protein
MSNKSVIKKVSPSLKPIFRTSTKKSKAVEKSGWVGRSVAYRVDIDKDEASICFFSYNGSIELSIPSFLSQGSSTKRIRDIKEIIKQMQAMVDYAEANYK